MPRMKKKAKKRPKLWFEGEKPKKPSPIKPRIGSVLGRPIRLGNIGKKPIRVQMGGMGMRPLTFKIKFPGATRMPSAIPMDVADLGKELLIKIDLPGVSKDNIKVKVTPTTLTVSAKREQRDTEQTDNFYRQERSFGSARRTITLPAEVLVDKVRAKYEQGVLRIFLAKKR